MRQPPVPLVAWHISCVFPSPADDYRESELDINELVIAHPEATHLCQGIWRLDRRSRNMRG